MTAAATRTTALSPDGLRTCCCARLVPRPDRLRTVPPNVSPTSLRSLIRALADLLGRGLLCLFRQRPVGLDEDDHVHDADRDGQ